MGLSIYGHNPPFQIDANFGMTAAMIEMLVFSKNGIIKLLPAIPNKWSHGKAKGIACRGGIVVDVEWDFQKGYMKASLVSDKDQTILIKLHKKAKRVEVSPSEKTAEKSELGDSYISIALEKSEPIHIQALL